MSTPIFMDLTADTWVKVATAVTTGQVHRVKTGPSKYLSTYIQPTGDPAPADDPLLGVSMFVDTESEQISFSASADVYVRSVGADGRVRVDV